MPRISKPSKASKRAKQLANNAAAIVPADTSVTTPVTPTVAKPAKPDYAAQRAERQSLIDAARAHVAQFYNGASLTVHRHKPPKLVDCIERINAPIQRAASGATPRDESLLARLLSESKADGLTFDPSSPSIAADIGAISRLASLAFIAVNADGKAYITDAGAERARLVTKRA